MKAHGGGQLECCGGAEDQILAIFTRERNAKTALQRRISTTVVMSLAAAIVATLALPAYAFSEGTAQAQREASEQARAQAQSVDVEGEAVISGVSKDSYAAETAEEVARQQANAEMAAYRAAYSGPSVAELLANPPYSSYDGDAIYNVALSLQGTPYVYGGTTPAGFDCSGYVQYVFAQFGVALPHSSAGQAAMGRRISEADARPGDLVIMPGHDGFWAGPGLILHAPYPGAGVRIQPVWESYYIVRLGI